MGIPIILLVAVGLVCAIMLTIASKVFFVPVDETAAALREVLPGANCGGCGFAGCRNFAEACVKAGSTDGLACPVGGDPTMEEVKKILVPAATEEVQPAAAGGEKKGFDPAIAAKIKALATPKATFPMHIGMAQRTV